MGFLALWKTYGTIIKIGGLLVLLGGAVTAVGVWHHKTLQAGIAQGVAEQKAEDDRARNELRAQVKVLQAEKQRMADDAKAQYDKDHAEAVAGASAPVGTRELCEPAHPHPGNIGVRTAHEAQPGAANPASPERVGGEVPATDNGFASDRRRLLGAFAAFFDSQNAVIREFQAR